MSSEVTLQDGGYLKKNNYLGYEQGVLGSLLQSTRTSKLISRHISNLLI